MELRERVSPRGLLEDFTLTHQRLKPFKGMNVAAREGWQVVCLPPVRTADPIAQRSCDETHGSYTEAEGTTSDVMERQSNEQN
jgi:hypothetical protein